MQDTTPTRQYIRLALAGIAAITLVRVVVVIVSPLELYPDEAQYWWWAQTPAFGYFSKPPMIAWIIWATTLLLGSAEWAIRIASPLLHGLASFVVFAIGRRAFDSRIGLLGALAYLTTPGVSYSSGLISTDVPLLLWWAVALYAFLRALDDKAWRWPVLCGAAIGLGLLAKYAMLYFLLGAAFAALFLPKVRALVLGPRGLVILAIGLLLVFPNIWWNAQHGFPTVVHTEANAGWGRSRFNPINMAVFLAGQFGVFGPVLMTGYGMALWRLGRGEREERALLLAAFSAPPLALMVVQSFIVTANANWAATAYVAATPLAVRELGRWWNGRALWASFAVDGLAMFVLWAILVEPAAAERMGLGNAFKREEGWRMLGREVAHQATVGGHYDAVATDNRSMIAELLYYARPCPAPMRAWSADPRPRDHFQMTLRLVPGTVHVLLAVAPQDAPHVIATFDSATPVQSIVVPVGGHHQRVTVLYDAHHYRGP